MAGEGLCLQCCVHRHRGRGGQLNESRHFYMEKDVFLLLLWSPTLGTKIEKSPACRVNRAKHIINYTEAYVFHHVIAI